MESIPWVRCASGNVFSLPLKIVGWSFVQLSLMTYSQRGEMHSDAHGFSVLHLNGGLYGLLDLV